MKVIIAITARAPYITNLDGSISPPAANTSDAARGYMYECNYYPLVVLIEPSVGGGLLRELWKT
jgi:hypothetical protein